MLHNILCMQSWQIATCCHVAAPTSTPAPPMLMMMMMHSPKNRWDSQALWCPSLNLKILKTFAPTSSCVCPGSKCVEYSSENFAPAPKTRCDISQSPPECGASMTLSLDLNLDPTMCWLVSLPMHASHISTRRKNRGLLSTPYRDDQIYLIFLLFYKH